ncbi:hypothetical protein ACFFRR_007519 [Megaselia abdita]
MNMKFSAALLVICALNVQGLPRQQILPPGLTSFHPQHLLLYVQDLASKEPTSSRSDDNDLLTNTQCYEKSSSSINEISQKAIEGNQKCENILSVAQDSATTELENGRQALDAQSTDIQTHLQLCQSNTDYTHQEALECYEKEGQSNINPVSSLSSNARNSKRKYENTINEANVKSFGCSYDVSEQSQTVSMEVFNNLNKCLTSKIWDEVIIPDFGPVDSTPKPTTQVTTEDTTPRVTADVTTPVVTAEVTTPVVTSDVTTPVVTAEVTTPQVTAEVTTPRVTDDNTTPQITAKVTTPQVTDDVTTPVVTAEVTTPVVTAEVTTPQVTAEVTTPQVTAEVTTPRVTEDITTPQITAEVTTPRVTDDVTTPIVTAEVTTPVVTAEVTKPQVPAEVTTSKIATDDPQPEPED